MAEALNRVREIAPRLPPEYLVHAFRLGASVSDVLDVLDLSGASLARAKIYLPAIRKNAVREQFKPDERELDRTIRNLTFIRWIHFVEDNRPEFSKYSGEAVSQRTAIGRVCDDQQRYLMRLRDLNERLMATQRSSLLGTRASSELKTQQDLLIANIEDGFHQLLKLGESRSRLMVKLTRFTERFLYAGGLEPHEIHAAAGHARTSRTVYNSRSNVRRAKPQRFPVEAVPIVDQMNATFLTQLANIAHHEDALAVLRISVKQGLAEIRNPSSPQIFSSVTTEQGSWTTRYWDTPENTDSRCR